MKVDTKAVLKELNGDPILVRFSAQQMAESFMKAGMPPASVDSAVTTLLTSLGGTLPKSEPLTWKDAVMMGLASADKDAPQGKLLDRIGLALKIQAAEEELEITNEQRDDIMLRVKAAYPSPLVLYRVHEVFKNAELAAAAQAAEVKAAAEAKKAEKAAESATT